MAPLIALSDTNKTPRTNNIILRQGSDLKIQAEVVRSQLNNVPAFRSNLASDYDFNALR